MVLNQQDVELLGAYWDNRLSAAERADLEQRLQQEPAFREAAAQLQALSIALDTARDQRIIQFLQQQDHALATRTNRRWIWLLLGVGLSVGAYFWLSRPRPPEAPANRIIVYLNPYPSPADNLSVDEPQLTGYAAYDKGRYAVAIPLLEKEFASSGDSLLLFYKGIACLHTNDPKSALALFSRFTGSATIPQDDNRWFLALAYVQAGRREEALNLLETLKLSPEYRRDAAALEKDLKENKK